eukprot:scaffold118886_cov39-Cyclotella_meneghiniana.AAC.2
MLGKQEVSNRRLHSGTEPWLLSLGWVERESEAWGEFGRSQSILTIETVVSGIETCICHSFLVSLTQNSGRVSEANQATCNRMFSFQVDKAAAHSLNDNTQKKNPC